MYAFTRTKPLLSNRMFRQACFLSSLLFVTALAQAGDLKVLSSTPPRARFVEGEVLVRFRDDITPIRQTQIARASGIVRVMPVTRKPGLQRLQLEAGHTVEAVIARLQADPAVEYAQPNYLYYAMAVPNDPRYNELWGLKNSGQTISSPSYTTNNPGTTGSDVDAELAWDVTTDCRSTIVAVLDTGIDYTHQDLATNMWDGGPAYPNHGWDAVDDDNDPVPVGGAEHHGTHVAGTIAAAGNNSLGSTGLCWQARLMAVRVLGANGSGTTADIIEGIQFAADNGAKVINMSLAGEHPFDTAYSNAIDYARDRDVLVVVAAGNGGSDGVSDDVDDPAGGEDSDTATRIYPCAFPHDNLLCVAALDQAYSLTTFSNLGATSVDVGAPGANILSNFPGTALVDDFSGWSMTGGWTATSCDLGLGPMNILSNPADWCPPSTNLYNSNADDVVYKVFNIGTNTTAALLTYVTAIDVAAGDSFATNSDSTGGDPFDGSNDSILLAPISGSSLPNLALFTHNLNGCRTANCAIGFRLTSDGATELTGIGMVYFAIDTLVLGGDMYELLDGTSMASPHVAGIATLVRAYNPDYTYADTIAAIRNGGEAISALSGNTTTGNAANAMGAMAYLGAPTAPVATIE